MNFSSLKNIPTMFFYLASVISFVLANLIRDKNAMFYYILLLIGLISFFLGIRSRIKTK
jgi:hypothetical protein